MHRLEQARFAAAVASVDDVMKRERPKSSLGQVSKIVDL
jgi:hypothetical protein